MDLLQGTLDVLVLRTLAWGSMHGYAVSRWIRQRTDGVLEIEDAPLYKALHRLERAGFVSAEWGLSENNRRGALLRADFGGRRQFKAEETAWRRYASRGVQGAGAGVTTRRKRLFRLPWRTKRQIRADVDEELRFHLDMRVDGLVALGLLDRRGSRSGDARIRRHGRRTPLHRRRGSGH